MSLSENPYDKIDHDYRVTVACDTDWAEWILAILDFDFEYNGNSYFRAEFPTADYEALKKLVEQNKEEVK